MEIDDREQLEATLRRADELEQANAALIARNAALVAGAAAPVVAKPKRGRYYALAATSVGAGVVFALIPGCEPLAAVAFILPLFALIAVGLLRATQWLDNLL